MKPAYESAVTVGLRPGARRYAHRPSGAVLVLVLAALVAVLLPSAAQAHDYAPPLSGHDEQINITPDGYQEGFYLEGRSYDVAGKGFNPGHPTTLFQCPTTNSVNLRIRCQPLGVVPADTSGNFTTKVYMRQTFTSEAAPYWTGFGEVGITAFVHQVDLTASVQSTGLTASVDGPGGVTPVTTPPTVTLDSGLQGTEVGGTTCFGRLGVQCSVVAAQFGPDLEPTSRAEHKICFEGAARPDTLCELQAHA